MDWGYDLLSETERALLRRLSVLAGGWTLEAAEAVCAADGVEAPDLLDLLTHLVDRSLVVMEEQDGGARYRLLETVRQYGRERLLESREADAARERHRVWCLNLAERAEPELQGPRQHVWLERLEAELDNLRAALGWSKATASGGETGGAKASAADGRDAETGLRLAGALLWFWYLRGYLSEGREWLEGMLSSGGEAAAPARAKALNGAGFLAWRQGDDGRAAALGEESLALYRQLEYPPGIAFSLNILGLAARRQGDYARAAELLEESLGLWRESEHAWGIALTLNILGVMARQQGDYHRATALGEESLALYRGLGDRGRVASSLNSLGLVAQEQGDYARAAARYEENLTIRRDLEDQRGIAESLNNLGLVVWHRGDDAAARSLYAESLSIRRELGDRRGIAGLLESFAILASAQGQAQRAACLAGAADALREVIGVPPPPADRARYDSVLAAARGALGETAFAAARAEGLAMTMEQAIEHALTVATSAGMPA
jgi:non-specific serine/threonine protein kinase